MHSSTNSPESGLGESRTSLPGSGGEEYYVDEIDAQPPLGTCRALYPFDGRHTIMIFERIEEISIKEKFIIFSY